MKMLSANDSIAVVLAIAMLLSLAACSAEPEPGAEQETDHILQSQTEALERAQAVEDQVLEAAEQRLDTVDEQTAQPNDG